MASKSSKIVLPPRGKEKIDLDRFNYKVSYRDCLFTIYLPCARSKPYYESRTHHYIKLKIKEYIPPNWRKLIRICTISEVIGIIPEELEYQIFNIFGDDYFYEHYPSYEEGDVQRTSNWLKEFITNEKYETKFNYCYCTSKIFREIALNSEIECLPIDFNQSSALFEYRKTENVKELMERIKFDYQNLLKSKFNKWKKQNSHPYKVLRFAKENTPFKFREFKKRFEYLGNPIANIGTFCHESDSDKGIFLYYNERDKRYYFPRFIKELLDF